MSQEIKPYLLMPVKRISWWIPRYYNRNQAVTTSSGFPDHTFALPDYPFLWIHGHPMRYLCGIWLLMVMNSYWYLICKTLLNEKLLYILLPIGVYGLLAGTEFIPEETGFHVPDEFGEGFIEWKHTRAFQGVIAAICYSASKSQATATLHL